ncbi:hypothetical protein NQZ68_020459 [Xyrichtys novacula]|uniref:Uncharacterized protein n=1 Tax=Xyrichtys novacula TaxID=13765 RepID=A0AAV1GHQ7_XYRNO|nr:hypothetical protein NQZ68_020459 [Xyrichtys novacula]
MRRSRLQAICNMTWGARYSTAPRPTNERARVSGYQSARTDPPPAAKARGEKLNLLLAHESAIGVYEVEGEFMFEALVGFSSSSQLK